MSDRTPTGDLRERLRKALDDSITAWWQTPPRLDYAADAVMHVVEGETAALRERVQAVVDEVLTVCDSFEIAPEGAPEYIYSLGRKDGLDWARAAVERAMGKGERNSIPYVPKEEAERQRDEALAAVQRVREAIESERAAALESEAMDGPKPVHDTRLNTCARIEDALREPSESGIRTADDREETR